MIVSRRNWTLAERAGREQENQGVFLSCGLNMLNDQKIAIKRYFAAGDDVR